MARKLLFSLVAVVAVLGLTATAGGTVRALITGAQIKDHTIGSRHLIDHTIQQHDLSAALAESLQAKAGPAGPPGPPGPVGPQGPSGSTAGYALIEPSGGVFEARTSGVTDEMIHHVQAGVYCIASLPAGTKGVVATGSSKGRLFTASDQFVSVDFAAAEGSPNYSGCPGSDQARLTVWDLSDGALTDSWVYVWFGA